MATPLSKIMFNKYDANRSGTIDVRGPPGHDARF
jgi:hypothetical protein